ncbi:putative quinol monooxygenase [Arthrobacter sp. GMC3]|uniref:putative quinol monooxygenase n=1 Tax=Arthrobacter sp. GMC3 TaxID=2058894 RepID=UPI000CE46A5B|nr:antibiotic biosynthesis monooxygenase [Arthrobacter sp. GMC3]
MSTNYFQVIAHYIPQPDEVENVLELLGQLAAASRTEAANISYDFFQGAQDAAHIVILERYTDAAGFAAHREYQHFKEIGLGQIIPKLASRRIESYEGSTHE